jgi:hypothetical protein
VCVWVGASRYVCGLRQVGVCVSVCVGKGGGGGVRKRTWRLALGCVGLGSAQSKGTAMDALDQHGHATIDGEANAATVATAPYSAAACESTDTTDYCTAVQRYSNIPRAAGGIEPYSNARCSAAVPVPARLSAALACGTKPEMPNEPPSTIRALSTESSESIHPVSATQRRCSCDRHDCRKRCIAVTIVKPLAK